MNEKVVNEYKGDFLKLLDIIRGSAIFHSFAKFTRGVEAIRQDGRIEVLRLKDRVTTPLDNGYRDVLLNLKIEGFEMIVELQLHFKDIERQKAANHRTYEYLRTLGWEKVGHS